MSLPASTVRRVLREVSELQRTPAEGIRLCGSGEFEDLSDVKAWVQGPPGTPFEGGYFKIRLSFGSDYPAAPPKCTFVTKIFHPNVNPSTGEICVNTLKKDWKSEYGISHILVVIKCLLIHPNPASALHAEAGRLLLEAYDDFSSRARLMTEVHATPREIPVEFRSANSSSTASTSTSKGAASPSTSSNTASASISNGLGEKNCEKQGEKEPLQASTVSNAPQGSNGSTGASESEGGKPLSAGTKRSGSSVPVDVPPAKIAATAPVKVAPVKKRGLKRL
ncbi:hypothetical protein T439DRAFT_329653 [Meredithblackwellia eburnea MCA 4105]